MKKDEYILNPVKSSSLSYWKTNEIRVPKNMKVINEYDFTDNLLEKYNFELYFKLIYYPKKSFKHKYELSKNIVFKNISINEFSEHINNCYDNEGVTVEELITYMHRPVYDDNLWICLYDIVKNKIVVTGIAEFDNGVKEGYLEWIQVSKEYRKKGFGKIIVWELLNRLNEKSDFVTVSGKVDNVFKPELLYESCGFRDKVLWYVLKEK